MQIPEAQEYCLHGRQPYSEVITMASTNDRITTLEAQVAALLTEVATLKADTESNFGAAVDRIDFISELIES